MRVRTQSGNAVAEVVHIYLSEMMGEKDYYIFGTLSAAASVFSGNRITLGIYRSKKTALEELDKIEEFFSAKPDGIYRMS